jgi:ethanolamine phosphate transferase 2 subunit G
LISLYKLNISLFQRNIPDFIIILLLISFIYSIIKFDKKQFIFNLKIIFIIWLLLINKISNIPLILLIDYQSNLTLYLFNHFNFFNFLIVYYWNTEISYFSFGYSISISSIDIGIVYTGIPFFNSLVIGILLLFNLFSSYFIYFLNFILFFWDRNNLIWYKICLDLFFNSFNNFLILLVMFIMKFHLFIWSVFSPKFLFDCFFSIFQFILLIFSFFFIK